MWDDSVQKEDCQSSDFMIIIIIGKLPLIWRLHFYDRDWHAIGFKGDLGTQTIPIVCNNYTIYCNNKI